MKIINYESDFKIIEGFKDKSPITTAPFRFSYYTKMSKRTYVAEYDGLNYTNCKPTDDGRIVVAFDNHKLGMGVLNVKREFFLTDKDFADGICNLVSVETTGITLDSGATDEIDDIVIEVFPFYQQGETGKSAYQEWLDLGNEGTVADFLASLKGDKGEDGKSFTYDDMTDAEKKDLAGHFNLEVVNNLEDGGKDKALSAEMGKRLNEMISEISLEGGGETKLSGKLNLADLNAVKAAQNGLQENEVRFFVITDSQGKIPSTQKCYDVPSDVVRQMSLKTGNSIVDLALSNVEVEPIGVSVGDLIALTKVSVKLSDLAEAVGVSISLSGSMLIYQYKILHTSGAREENYEEGCTKGVYGLLSPWDKQLIDGSAKPTRYGYGHNPDDMLQSGVLAYTSATIDGILANWTIFVDCSASPDGSGFYHLTQTAVGRDAGNLGEVYMRLGYYQKGGAPTFTPWRHATGSGSGSGGYQPPIGGIPKKDLSQEVQTSLGKADTALQEAFAENLLLNARFSNNAEKWDGSGYQVINDIHGRGVSGVKLDNGNVEQYVDVEEGYHTLSFWHTGLGGENYVYVSGDCEEFESDLGEVGGSGEYILPNHYTPKKHTIRFYAYEGTLPISFEAGGEMNISEVKLEKSKKASDFSLNTLDIADKYSVPTKDEVATAIANAITNTLNTEV